jgi:hypothetical protein
MKHFRTPPGSRVRIGGLSAYTVRGRSCPCTEDRIDNTVKPPLRRCIPCLPLYRLNGDIVLKGLII